MKFIGAAQWVLRTNDSTRNKSMLQRLSLAWSSAGQTIMEKADWKSAARARFARSFWRCFAGQLLVYHGGVVNKGGQDGGALF
jgi:hypothetical protein